MRKLRLPSASRYRKRVGAFGGIDAKHDESVISFSTAKECYNFDFTSGALRDGYGIAAHAAVPDNATRYWVYRYYSEEAGDYVDQYVFQKKSGHLCYYDSHTERLLYVSGAAYPPVTALNYRLNGEDVLLLSCDGHRLLTWNGRNLVEHSGSPVISSMALHYERLFVTSPDEPTKVFFSADLDPTNWTTGLDEGGFIELLDERGELTKVVSFLNYLYIFREHGISRVTAFADQSEFAVTNLYVSAGRIYPESIVKCGSVILFLASDGLYVFDGYDCTKAGALDGLFCGKPSASAFFDGKYFLSCSVRFSDGEVGCEAENHSANALLVLSPSSGEYSLSRGLNITFMSACTYLGEDFLMAYDGAGGVIQRCGARFGDPLPKKWAGPCTDFGAPDRVKSVREVYVDTAAPCSISLVGEKKVKRAEADAGKRRIRQNIDGRYFSLVIEAEGVGCNIRPPTLIYTVR